MVEMAWCSSLTHREQDTRHSNPLAALTATPAEQNDGLRPLPPALGATEPVPFKNVQRDAMQSCHSNNAKS